MKNSHFLFFTITFLSAVILINACGQKRSEWQGTVEEVKGVRVVKNPEEPIYGADIFDLTEELLISSESDDYPLINVMSKIQVDKNNDIYILDHKSRQVFRFNSRGDYVNNFGRKGAGPGEFQSPFSFDIIGDSEIVILDQSRRYFCIFSLSGEYLREINAVRVPSIRRLVFDSKNNIYCTNTVWGNQISIPLKKYNSSFEEILTIEQIEFQLDRKIRKFYQYPDIFMGIKRNDDIVWANNMKYEINISNDTGRIIMKIIKDYTPVDIKEEDIKKELKNNHIPQDQNVNFPKYYPPFQFFIIDDKDRIYVKTYREAENGGYYYDIFDFSGKYMASIVLKTTPRLIKRDRLYSIEENEAGIQGLRRYKITWTI